MLTLALMAWREAVLGRMLWLARRAHWGVQDGVPLNVDEWKSALRWDEWLRDAGMDEASSERHWNALLPSLKEAVRSLQPAELFDRAYWVPFHGTHGVLVDAEPRLDELTGTVPVPLETASIEHRANAAAAISRSKPDKGKKSSKKKSVGRKKTALRKMSKAERAAEKTLEERRARLSEIRAPSQRQRLLYGMDIEHCWNGSDVGWKGALFVDGRWPWQDGRWVKNRWGVLLLSPIEKRALWEAAPALLHDTPAQRVPAFLGKMIKDFGESAVVEALSAMSSLKEMPASPTAYFRGMVQAKSDGSEEAYEARSVKADVVL